MLSPFAFAAYKPLEPDFENTPIPPSLRNPHDCPLRCRSNSALVRAESPRLVRAATLARGQQLHSEIGDQRAGDVAGVHVRPRADRPGTGLGRIAGHEYHAGLSPRPAVAARRAGLSEAS